MKLKLLSKAEVWWDMGVWISCFPCLVLPVPTPFWLSGSRLCKIFPLQKIAQCCEIYFHFLPAPAPVGFPSPALSSPASCRLPTPLLPGSRLPILLHFHVVLFISRNSVFFFLVRTWRYRECKTKSLYIKFDVVSLFVTGQSRTINSFGYLGCTGMKVTCLACRFNYRHLWALYLHLSLWTLSRV